MPKPKKAPAAAPAEQQLPPTEQRVYAQSIEVWPLDRFVMYEKNPRRHSDAVIERMAVSLLKFGFPIPMLMKKSNAEVIDGHLRLKGARKAGLAEAPWINCDGWTPAQVKAFRLMANRSVNWAEWDTELLALEFGDLKELEFDLALTGFSDLELLNLAGDSNKAPDSAQGNWGGMPGFTQDDLTGYRPVIVHFANEEDRRRFADLIGQELNDKTKSIWFPAVPRVYTNDKCLVSQPAS